MHGLDDLQSLPPSPVSISATTWRHSPPNNNRSQTIPDSLRALTGKHTGACLASGARYYDFWDLCFTWVFIFSGTLQSQINGQTHGIQFAIIFHFKKKERKKPIGSQLAHEMFYIHQSLLYPYSTLIFGTISMTIQWLHFCICLLRE